MSVNNTFIIIHLLYLRFVLRGRQEQAKIDCSKHLPRPSWANFMFKYKIMYEHRRRQFLILYIFFQINFLLHKKKYIVVDGCARGKFFHSMVAVTSLTTGLGTTIMYIRRVATCTQSTQLRTHCHSREHFMMLQSAIKY